MQSEKIILRHTFSEMVEAYNEKGIKGLFESIADKDVIIVEEEQVSEEATNDEFKAELKDAIDKSLGKKKAKVADAAVQAVEVQKEEVEQIEEVNEYHKIAVKHLKDIMSKTSTPAQKEYAKKMNKRALEAAKIDDPKAARKHYTNMDEEVEQIEEAHSVMYKMKKDAKKISVAHYPSKEDAQKFLDDIKTKGGNGIVKAKISEETELDERHLTADEKAEMEKNVKGMKKNMSSFKDRYGDRAKEVMYATATKQAKED